MERDRKNPDSLEEFIKTSAFLTKAYKFAKDAHEGQFRAEGTSYFSHCEAVAQIGYEEWGITDQEKIAALLLHDTTEDTKMTLEDIVREFSPRTAFYVDGVSKFRSEKRDESIKSKEQKDRETIRKVFTNNLIDPFVGVAKIADRLHNMRTLKFMPIEKQIAKARETESYAKLAESLGMWEAMRELEDLSMKYANSADFEKYSKIRDIDARTQPEFVAWLASTLKNTVNTASVNARVETRKISLSKLKNKKGKYLTNEINDLISFRVIVENSGPTDTRNNVYKMLGAVREVFAQIEDIDRFDDFYSHPRDNNYSAIQLTLNFPQGATEVAITCDDKEEFNRWGVVSLIKRGDPNLAKHALKLLFTTTQEVKFFPPAATGLDFAYSISPKMGARAEYVLVDGAPHPITTVIPNGAEVEVILGKPRIAPKKERLGFCLPQTLKIMQEQISEERKWELENKGKVEIGKIIAKRGLIDLTDLLKIDKFKPVLESLLFLLGCKGSLNDLYYKIGSGVMAPEDLEIPFDKAEITKRELGLTSILIEGIDGPGITSLVSSKISALGGNIGPMENMPHKKTKNKTFTLRMVVENLTVEKETELAKDFQTDSRIKKVIVV